MLKNLLILVISMLTFNLSAQNITLNVLKKADDAFEKFSYSKAVEYYKLALKSEGKKSYVTSQLALSYRNLNESDSAEVWFKKAIDNGETNPDFNFYLAEALLSNQKVEEAKYWYQQYDEKVEGDNRSDRKLSVLDDLDQFFVNKDRVFIEQIKHNSPGLDFSPAFYREGIMFVSSRPKSAWVMQEFNWDNSSFLDLYSYSRKDTVAKYSNQGLNTKYHEGPLAFYNKGKSVVYTRNNYDGNKLSKDAKGVTNLKLYFAEWDSVSSKWVKETPFVFNDDDYSIGSPAITEDGKTLIFSSDMPGGLGASDMYITHRSSKEWSKPENLGKKVNSKGRDGFPSFYKNLLYFASEGREGLGGLDMYQIEFDGQMVIGDAKNLGAPFNSNKDDFGLIRKGEEGYFASNRNKATSDDIYTFLLKEPELVLVSGDVYDIDANTPITLANVFIKGLSGDTVHTKSGNLGKYEAYVLANSTFILSAGKFKYSLVDEIRLETKMNSAVVERIYLRKIPVAEPDTLNVGDTIRIDMIYYDFDESALRDVSKELLVEVANFMTEHVDVKVILISHTDSRSSSAYNNALAKRRSDAAERYLIEIGVDPLKLSNQSFGESKLQNSCKDGEECSEEQHQLNRRTEIIFIKTKKE